MKRKNRNEQKPKSLSLSSYKVKQESKKPCEVCGSVGIERLMMICFKCRDTREHTYCAKVFLPAVPSIWLCEVCRTSSRLVVVSNVAEDRMETETSAADCSSDPKKTNSSRDEDQETAKLTSNDMEEVVDPGIYLPVLQASISDSTCELCSEIHPLLQPHTSLVDKEASSVPDDTSEEKQQLRVSLAFPKKHRTFRLTRKHLSQPRQSLISSRNQSCTEMLHQSVNQERLS